MDKSINMGRVVFLAVVAAIGGILFGYDTAVISGTTEIVKNQFQLKIEMLHIQDHLEMLLVNHLKDLKELYQQKLNHKLMLSTMDLTTVLKSKKEN